MAAPHLRLTVLLSIGAAVVTLLLKWVAYHLTGSVGLFSEAAESGVNLVAALTAFFSLWYASRPVDPTHTYGHEKIEYLSAGIEGGFIILAALGIAGYAIRRLMAPEPLEALDVGTWIAAAAAAINLVVGQILLRVGRAHHSLILQADGRHLMTDVWTSAGVIAGLVLVWLTGRPWLDPLLGLGVAVNIFWTGADLLWISFKGLMDHALPEAEQQVVRTAIEGQLSPGMDYHALRTRQAGQHRFADFHLLVPGRQSVRQAHEITKRIEHAIREALPGIEVTIHVEPIEDQASWQDSELLPIEQAARQARAEEAGGSGPAH